MESRKVGASGHCLVVITISRSDRLAGDSRAGASCRAFRDLDLAFGSNLHEFGRQCLLGSADHIGPSADLKLRSPARRRQGRQTAEIALPEARVTHLHASQSVAIRGLFSDLQPVKEGRVYLT